MKAPGHNWPSLLKWTALICLPLVAAAQAAKPTNQWPEQISFASDQISERSATLKLTNSAGSSETWVASLAPDAGIAATIQVLPATPQTVEPRQTIAYTIVPGANPVGAGTYTLAVRRQGDPTGTTLESTKLEIVKLDLRPVSFPGTGGVKYVFEASREFPFSKWGLAGAAIYLTPPPHPGAEQEAARRYLANWHGRVLGLLSGGATAGSDDMGAALVCANRDDGPADRILLNLADTNRFRSGKLTGKAAVPGGTVDVTVQTRDRLLWPLLLAALGVWLAFWVSNFSARGRALAVLRAQLADIDRTVRVAALEFRRTAAFSRYDILPAWGDFQRDIESRLMGLRVRAAPLDAGNADFTQVNADLKNRQQLPAGLLDFGRRLDRLHTLSERMKQLKPPGTFTSAPQIVSRFAPILEGAPFATLADFDTRVAATKDAGADAELWTETFDRLDKMRQDAASTPALQTQIDTQLGRLWTDRDAALIQDVAAKTRTIGDQLGAAAGAAGQPAAPPTAGVGAREGEVAAGGALLVVQRGDAVSAGVAVLIGVLVALNTVYFPGPFGSIGDYFRIVAVALTTKVGVDLAAAAFNRIGDAARTIGGQTITRG